MSELKRLSILAAALVAAACSSGAGDDDSAHAAPALPVAPVKPLAAIEVAPARAPSAPQPPLADVIAQARAAAADLELDPETKRGPRVTLYEVGHEFERVIETGDVWRKFQLALYRGFKRCYRNVLRKDRTASGRATISMRIVAGGRVDQLKVSDAFDERISPCLKRYAGGWKFGVLADDLGAVLSLTVGFEP